jgi:hypothetical protein
MHQFGFSSRPHNTGLFIHKSNKGLIFLPFYVDEKTITWDDHSGIFDFKNSLHWKFEMKNLGHLSYFLGLKFSSDSTDYYLSQAKYASDLLSHVDLTDTKVVSTPLKMNDCLTPLDGIPLSVSLVIVSLLAT